MAGIVLVTKPSFIFQDIEDVLLKGSWIKANATKDWRDQYENQQTRIVRCYNTEHSLHAWWDLMTEEFSHRILNKLPFQFHSNTDMPLKTGVNITEKMQNFFKTHSSLQDLMNWTYTRPPIKAIATLVADVDDDIR